MSDEDTTKEEVKDAAEDAVEEAKEAAAEAKEEVKEAAADAKTDEKSPEVFEAKASDGPEEEKAAQKEEKSELLKKAERLVGEHKGRREREAEQEDLFEKVVHINRCAKVVKGGRRFSFSALVVSGDRDGKVGIGFGKAQEVAECIKKAAESSKKEMQKVNITQNTIPHRVVGEHRGGKVLLRPASPGTGLIAGGGVRAVVEAAGIKDVLAKSLGSNNHANVVKATLDALNQLRTKEEIYGIRGKRVEEKKAL